MVQTKSDSRRDSIIALVAAIIPLIIWLFCLIYSGGSFVESGNGSAWILIGAYYYSVGIPLFIVFLIFGSKGLKTKYRNLAIISAVIKIVNVGLILGIFLANN